MSLLPYIRSLKLFRYSSGCISHEGWLMSMRHITTYEKLGVDKYMHILNKNKLKETFRNYTDMAVALGYKSTSSFRGDRKNRYDVLSDDVIMCPEKLRKRFDKYGYEELYYTVDERILINAMIYGKFVIANDVMRVVVGLMLDGLTKTPPKVFWSFSDLRQASEYKINERSIEKIITDRESKVYFEIKEETGEYSLNVRELTRSCQ